MTAEEIRHAAGVLFAPGQVVEVRAFGDGRPRRSGYFDDLDALAEKTDALAADPSIDGIYWTLNPCNPDLLARHHNTFGSARATTTDGGIVCRRWLLVDADPERPSGTSATTDEKAAAFKRADAIAVELEAKGWPAPVRADSGNGVHLLYRVDLPNDADATALIRRCLESLSACFTDTAVKVDVSVSNAARIGRVYGTPNRKGSNMPDRPHRSTMLIAVPDELEPVPVELLQALAAEAGEPTRATPTGIAPATGTDGRKPEPGIDLRAWLERHSERLAELEITLREKSKVGLRYFAEFDQCPWSKDHTAGAYIGQADHGGIYARCHHDSCGGQNGRNRWPAFWAFVDPTPEPTATPKPKKAKAKNDGDETPKRVLPHFEKDGRLYLDVRDEHGHHWFAHLDDAGELAFSREVIGADGIAILPRELPIHQDTGMAAAIVGLPSKEAMEAAAVMDPGMLFDAINRHLKKYIDVPDDERELFIYYQFYTWFYRKTRTAPYLRFIADSGKGKSRIIRGVSDLCFYPVRAAGASSFSGIFRNKERWHGTLVVDESDLQGGADNPVVKYLNLGFEADQPFILSDKNDPSTVHLFDPFGPKVIGMRQKFGDMATEGRCLSFSPRETRRRDIPVEVDDAYDEAVTILRAHLARFALAHWSDVTTEALMDVTAIDVEPRLKQMLRPISLVLSVFPDGEVRLTDYVRARQIEIRQTRSESNEGKCFNLALKLANRDEDLMDDPKFGKYYRHGTLQAVEARMIGALTGWKTNAVSKLLRGIGFATKETSIKVQTVGPAKDGEQGKIGERKLTVSKMIVPDVQAWREMVSRYYFQEPTDAQAGLDAFGSADLDCPELLQGPFYEKAECSPRDSGTAGTTGTNTARDPTSTGNTGSTENPYEHPAIIETDPNTVLSVTPAMAGEYVFIQSNPKPCWQCGRAPSQYVARPPGGVIDMADPSNNYLCKRCHVAMSATATNPEIVEIDANTVQSIPLEADGDEVAA
jgi:hypothetical protein